MMLDQINDDFCCFGGLEHCIIEFCFLEAQFATFGQKYHLDTIGYCPNHGRFVRRTLLQDSLEKAKFIIRTCYFILLF